MRPAPAIIVGCAVLLLAGCAPDTSSAETACYQYISDRYLAEHPGLATDDAVDAMVVIRESCASDAAADPQGFIALWSD